jgi:hypothetical protein
MSGRILALKVVDRGRGGRPSQLGTFRCCYCAAQVDRREEIAAHEAACPMKATREAEWAAERKRYERKRQGRRVREVYERA